MRPLAWVGSIHICRAGVIINSPFFQKCLVWLINFRGILPLTKCTTFYIHFNNWVCRQPGSWPGLRRGWMTSEYSGGTVASAGRVLLIPLGSFWALHPAAGYTQQMLFLKTLGLKIKPLVLDYKAKLTSGSFPPCLKPSSSSRFLTPPASAECSGVCSLRQVSLSPVSFLVRMGGTFLGRKKNTTTRHIVINDCQTYIREFGQDITCLPNRAIKTIWILCEYLGVGRNFGD